MDPTPDFPPTAAVWVRERFLKQQSRWTWRLAGQLAKTLPAWLKNNTSEEGGVAIFGTLPRGDARVAACDREYSAGIHPGPCTSGFVDRNVATAEDDIATLEAGRLAGQPVEAC
jgi:hypothetical protein